MTARVHVPNIPWGITLEEYARPLEHVLRDMTPAGKDVEVWLGAHHPDVHPPAHAIVYQTEVAGSSWFTPAYRAKLANARAVWDYSSANAGGYECKAWAHVPLRYHPCLETVPAPEGPYIRVGFCGSMNEHRTRYLEGAEVMPAMFGAARDAWLARVCVMAVPHFYPNAPVEQNRIGHLLANGIPVVAEYAPDQADYPGPLYVAADAIMPEALRLSTARGVGARQREAFIARGTAHAEVSAALRGLP